MKHRISAVNPHLRRGTCAVCGPTWLKRRERDGRVSWSCGRRHNAYSKTSTPKGRIGKLAEAHGLPPDRCWDCGFEAIALAQLDIHHLNEDHDDNRPENLMLLCANCHRFIHAVGGKWALDVGVIEYLSSRGLSCFKEEFKRASAPARAAA